MSRGTTSRGPELSDADRRIVRYLSACNADYPALIASNTGLHIPLVERRCAALREQELIEPASGEVVYRLTERGRAIVRQ